MSHADNLAVPGHGWAVGAWTILIAAAVLGISSNQTSQWFSVQSEFHDHSVASAANEMATVARLAVARHDTFPIILTIPFAVTRTQRMSVARVKHRAEFPQPADLSGSRLKKAPGFLAGLALIEASHASNH